MDLIFYTIVNWLYRIGVTATRPEGGYMLNKTEYRAIIRFSHLLVQGKFSQTIYEDVPVVYSEECPCVMIMSDK